jgi:hypothetical protein
VKFPWYYNGKIFTSEDLEKDKLVIGFVYLITNLSNNKKYIGKKLFYSKKVVQKNLKKKKVKIESDWKEYFGSCEELKEDVKTSGKDNFKREIIHLCKSKGVLNYLELAEQVENKVLLRDDYYNSYIGGRIHKKHLKDLFHK